MGMLMNRFNMLTQLRKDIKNHEDHGLNYNRFVLSAIIVHDCNDKNLTDCISRNFVRWAEMTGEYFLFITFVHPSNDWKQSRYCHDAYWIDNESLMVDNNCTEEEEERTIPLLRDFFGLSQEGSYLIITENISSKDFQIVPITTNTIENQLQLLTEYCNVEASGKEHTPAEYKNLLNSLKADACHINMSILDILIDFTSITSKIINYKEKTNQLKHADGVIDRLRNELKKYNGPCLEDQLFHLFEAMIIVFTKFQKNDISLLNPSFRNSTYSTSISEQYLDDYSKKLYKSYSLLSSFFKYKAEDIDYSGLTIYLGKIVENELNVSICQMLRCSMGIIMPEYFNKYCEIKDDVNVRVGNQNVKLNEAISEGSTKLKAIPMGPLLFAYKTMYCHPERISPRPQTDKIEELDSTMLDFLNDYRSKYRNAAAHIDSNSDVTYQGAKVAFKQFLDEFIEKLYNIRIKLSTPKEA